MNVAVQVSFAQGWGPKGLQRQQRTEWGWAEPDEDSEQLTA